MSKVLTYQRADGGISVVHPTPENLAKHGGDANAALLAQQSKVVPVDATNPEIIDLASLPTDRKFRNAWKQGVAAVDVDMPQARVIHMDKIREHRRRQFLKLDEVRRNAEDDGDATALTAAKAKRVLFKDIPQTSQEATDITAATTPSALDAIWPTTLLGARPTDI